MFDGKRHSFMDLPFIIGGSAGGRLRQSLVAGVNAGLSLALLVFAPPPRSEGPLRLFVLASSAARPGARAPVGSHADAANLKHVRNLTRRGNHPGSCLALRRSRALRQKDACRDRQSPGQCNFENLRKQSPRYVTPVSVGSGKRNPAG